jgi:hypothetical protein
MAARRRSKRAPAKTSRSSSRGRARTSIALEAQHLVCIDSIIRAVKDAGGPAFSRSAVVHALVDSALGRTFDATRIRSAEDLRVAFGGLDLSAVERMLKERPRIERGLLKALEDSIK